MKEIRENGQPENFRRKRLRRKGLRCKTLPDTMENPGPYPPDTTLSTTETVAGEMLAAILAQPFPRTNGLHIFTDQAACVRATVPHHPNHYAPDAIAGGYQSQYRAGSAAAGSPGLYELALCTLAFYLPSGFNATEGAVLLHTAGPKRDPVEISYPAWELHPLFAEEVLLGVDPLDTLIPAEDIYHWISSKRPGLASILLPNHHRPSP